MTKTELAESLVVLAELMEHNAVDMRECGHKEWEGELLEHADELDGAAEIARGWAQGLRENS